MGLTIMFFLLNSNSHRSNFYHELPEVSSYVLPWICSLISYHVAYQVNKKRKNSSHDSQDFRFFVLTCWWCNSSDDLKFSLCRDSVVESCCLLRSEVAISWKPKTTKLARETYENWKNSVCFRSYESDLFVFFKLWKSIHLSLVVEKNGRHIVSNKPFLSLHNDVRWRLMSRPDICWPNHNVCSCLDFHCSVKLEYGLECSGFANYLPTAENDFLKEEKENYKMSKNLFIPSRKGARRIVQTRAAFLMFHFFCTCLISLVGQFHVTSLGINFVDLNVASRCCWHRVVARAALFALFEKSSLAFSTPDRRVARRCASRPHRWHGRSWWLHRRDV